MAENSKIEWSDEHEAFSYNDEQAQSRYKELKGNIWRIAFELESGPADEHDFVDRLRKAVMDFRCFEQDEVGLQVIRRQRAKAEKQRKHNEECHRIITETRANNKALQEAERALKKAEAEKKMTEAEAAYAEILALEGRKTQLAKWAISTGVLIPINETLTESQVGRQRRSNRGVISIESGDGK